MELKLNRHNIVLKGQHILLRPLTEDDWAPLLAWNNDAEILYYVEGDNISSRSLDEVQTLYRSVSHQAFCFMIELEDQPIGEGWLQPLNKPQLLHRHPQAKCNRIDLMIGEKVFWGRGIGTEVIQLLTTFAFEHEQADCVFGCDVAEDNRASQKAFQKAGYHLYERSEPVPGMKAQALLDFVPYPETSENP